jgi:uncharacterized protein (TIGR03435 family)
MRLTLTSWAAVPLRASGAAVLIAGLLAVEMVAVGQAYSAESQTAPSARRAFEVASVKISKAEDSSASKISGATPGRFIASGTPLRFLILYAYRLLDHQLVGAPDWASTTTFDITATYPPGPAPGDDEVRLMLQELLVERFGLSVHTDHRELTSYKLVVVSDARLGPQLSRSDVDCQQWLAEKRPQADAGGPSKVTPSGKRPACMMLATRRWLSGGTRTMEQLAATLQSIVGKPVVDRTGLTGAYDVDLKWSPDDLPSVSTAETAVNDGLSIFGALQEQLGLKLAGQRDQFDVIVIDHVARPTAN